MPSQVPPHNAIVDEFGTSLSMNFGMANGRDGLETRLNYNISYITHYL